MEYLTKSTQSLLNTGSADNSDLSAKDFDERKAELKDLGYTWNGEKKAWSLR
jgi:hypothetical protein